MPVAFLKNLLRRSRPTPLRIAAGSTAQFPVISHTFVYQELTAMHQMLGADVRVFHTLHGDAGALHQAFRYLDQNRRHFASSWDRHAADYAYFKSTRPAEVESLLEALHQASGLSREDLERRHELLLAFTFARLVEEWGADYVHTYFFYDQALNGLVTSRLLGIPRGVSAYADHMMDDWPLKLVPLHLDNAEVIVATSRRIAGELLEIGGAQIESKIVVKPNGVDGARFPVTAKRPLAGRPLELICMTRIEPKKGLLELAEAVKLLRDRDVDIRVHIIGGADVDNEASERYAADLDQRVRELAITDHMLLHGRMRQELMGPYLERADAFIAPFVETESGDKDGIPTAILEGMSSALPVVATDAGSIPEIIDDGIEGFVVPQRDPTALADAIERLARGSTLAAELGHRARARFEREFDIRATEPRLHERIRAAVAAHASAVR